MEAARRYTVMQLETASHPKIIWMIHAKCVHLIQQAALTDAMFRKNLLIRAQNLLAELEGSLKITDEVSKGLFYLYDYCYCLLDTDDPQDHSLALKVLSSLRDTLGTFLKIRTIF